MPQDGARRIAHIIRCDQQPAVNHRIRFRGNHQKLGGARPGPAMDPFFDKLGRARVGRASGSHQPRSKFHNVIGDRHPADHFLQLENLRTRQNLLQLHLPLAGRHLGNGLLILFGRIIDIDAEHEPVELRLGQGIGAFLFERILRGQHEEGRSQLIRLPAGGDALFLHRFEERRLRLGRRPVNFVRQENIGEDRPLNKPVFLLARLLIHFQHVRAGNIGGHQVRGKLDPAELQVQHFGKRPDHHRLREARHADHQDMPLGNNRGQ